jgi:outer membrane lipoprotein-sorting protein
MKTGAILCILGAAVPAAFAALQENADEIVKASNEAFFAAGKNLKARVTMKLVTKDGKERVRELTMLRRNVEGGDQKYFMYFHKPQDVRRMAFLVWKYAGREDDRWIFIPAIDAVRRIAASDKRASFVGSDFTYEDVSGRDLADDTHRILRKEKLGERDCVVVESVPKNSEEFAKRLTWMDAVHHLPLKIEYQDAQAETVRVFTADEVGEIGKHWTITKRTMKNLRSGHRTEVAFTSTEYDLDMEEDLFTERNLKNPPAKWIK